MEQKKKGVKIGVLKKKKYYEPTLIAQSAHILEDKSMKTSVNMQKIKEWKIITNKFNEITGKYRSHGELKLAWKRMKLSAKANLCTYRREQLKTGGDEKPPSPSEDLEIMAIASHDFVVEFNDYDSDAVNPVTVATSTKEIFADPKPRLSFGKDTAIVINIENPEPNVVEVQEISNDPYISKDTESAKMIKITNNETVNTRGITKREKRKKGLQNRHKVNFPSSTYFYYSIILCTSLFWEEPARNTVGLFFKHI